MPIYNVQLTDTDSIEVEADNPQDAAKIAKASLFNAQLTPYAENIMFDYESGVPNIKGIRSKLGRLEILPNRKNPFIEQDEFMQGVVGRTGFTRDSSGKLALTPEGMEQLGLKAKKVQLNDGTEIEQNTIIDENSFGLMKGDLADLSGIAGPALGTILALSPQRLALGNFLKYFGNKPRLDRMLRSAAGAVFGEGTEEFIDYQQGLNLKTAPELRKNLAREGQFGFIGQGFAEFLGAGYQLLLGKRGTSNIRALGNNNAGRSAIDIARLDRRYGREATEKEIKKAIKEGLVKLHPFKGVPSQMAVERPLVGRGQQIYEAVLGNPREKGTVGLLFSELDHLLKYSNIERAALKDYVDDAIKGGLDLQINTKKQALRSSEKEMNKVLNDIFKNLSDDITNINLYGVAPAREEIGQLIKDGLNEAYDTIMKQAGTRYGELDKMILGLRPEVQQLISDRIYYTRVPRLQAIIDDYKGARFSNKGGEKANVVNAAKEDAQGIIPRLQEIVDDMRSMYETGMEKAAQRSTRKTIMDPEYQLNLQRVRNTLSDLMKDTDNIIISGNQSKVLKDFVREFDSNRFGYKDSILTDFEDPKYFMARETASGRPIYPEGLEPNLIRSERQKILDITSEIREANELFASRINVFDSQVMKNMVASARAKGALDEYDVFDKVVMGSGKDRDLKNIFKALEDHDAYLNNIDKGAEATNAIDLRTKLQRRLFQDALERSSSTSDEAINFPQFVREIDKFAGRYPGKLDILFDGKGTQVRQMLDQINRIGPDIKPGDVGDLINDITRTQDGLYRSEAGIQFLDALEERAKRSAARVAFENNRLIKNLPDVGIDQTVKKIFVPGGASNIEILKKTVSPEVFDEIKAVSMNRLLSRAVDLNGKGSLTDMFKPGHLKNALDNYGDETLEAMFGRETARDLRSYQKLLDSATLQEVGRGSGGAGGLVAGGLGAGIAMGMLNINMIPLIAGMAIMRNVLSRPGFVGLSLKTDKNSILQIVRTMIQAARQEGVSLIADSYADIEANIDEEILKQTGALPESDEVEEITQPISETAKDFFDTAKETIQGFRTTQVDFPEVEAVQQFGGLTPERIDFAERIAGRPIV